MCVRNTVGRREWTDDVYRANIDFDSSRQVFFCLFVSSLKHYTPQTIRCVLHNNVCARCKITFLSVVINFLRSQPKATSCPLLFTRGTCTRVLHYSDECNAFCKSIYTDARKIVHFAQTSALDSGNFERSKQFSIKKRTNVF